MLWIRSTYGLMRAAPAALLLSVSCGGAEVEPAMEEAEAEAPTDMAAVMDGSVPINDLPNPYNSSIDGWGKLPDGREWGSTAGVDIDPDGSLWAIDRCGGNSCAGSDLDPILKFDTDGNVTAAIGGGLFLFPHGAARGPRQQRLGDRRAGTARGQPRHRRQGPCGHQAQPPRVRCC